MANYKGGLQRKFDINLRSSFFSELSKKCLLQNLRRTPGFAGSFSLNGENVRLNGGREAA